ncbi:MAG: hypothetical protein AVDCRST_MAG57-2053 [uncultured Blastococcus sp.]|uniref:Uncharacterized protein n=1 Tax=uncultured Blastococcus sp. TaxID=217144 RepID=A0A6J4IHM6_9ACTN|nr:MAG: hypothetical protein AVDCRST_MAG57-2053 [uncultured Blastococcus sp.]
MAFVTATTLTSPPVPPAPSGAPVTEGVSAPTAWPGGALVHSLRTVASQ